MPSPLDAIFQPRSVAVVGASDRPGSIGREIMRNLLDYGFQGPVFPVNLHARVVHSIKAYPRVSEIPDLVDLAIVAVPRESVLDVVKDCGEAGVRGLVVITAGFREIGSEGKALEEQVIKVCRACGMRLMGPNCMGVLNTDPAIRLLGSFAATPPEAGHAAFMSQSGALGVAILDYSRRLGVGLSMFASLGNKADISADDLLEYWDHDPSTRLILMYLESFGSPTRFSRLARRISRRKPVVAVKAGHTARGARAAQSHTGALAGTEIAIDSMMAQCGIIRVGSIDELFDVASVLGSQPLPRGRRLAIVTNAGGPGILATDAAETLGLEVTPFAPSTRETLAQVLPVTCSVQNPLDLVAGADAERYAEALHILARVEDVDMFLIIFVSPAMIDATAVAQEIAAFAGSIDRPVVACIMGKLGEENALEVLRGQKVPTFLFPESAVRGLHALARHAEWRRRPRPEYPTFSDVDPARARAALEPTAAAAEDMVPTAAAATVLEAYGIRLARIRAARSEEEALRAAQELGLPVALKVAPSQDALVHKSDIGGVRLNLVTGKEVTSTFRELEAVSRQHGGDGSVLVQEMLGCAHAKELILGLKADPQFGHLLMVGAGGIYVEYTKDIAFRVCPIDERDAREMLESLRTYPILQGVRGEPPCRLDVVVDAMLRLSALAGDLPEILECDLNPFVVSAEAGCCGAVDVRLRIKIDTPPEA